MVAAAVILHPDADLPGLADSKQLTHDQRVRLFPHICRAASAIAIAWVDPRTIDSINILQASLTAMDRAIRRLPLKPALVLVDGNQRLPRYSGPQRSIIGGDAHSAAIAAAAIIAKVQRDRYMRCLDARHPAYGFAGHKGYHAPVHIAALRTHGRCDHHRMSFHIRALDEPLLPAFDQQL